MAKKVKKLSRKELLQEDEFIVRAKEYFSVLLANRKFVYLGIGAILGTAILVMAINTMVRSNRADTQQMLASALEYYKGPVVTQAEIDENPVLKTMKTFPDEKTKFEQSAEKFDAVYKEHSGSRAGVLSLFYAANCYFQIGQFDTAADRYEKYVQKVGNNRRGTFLDLALEGLGFSLEAAGNPDEAINAFQKLIDQDQNKAFRERALFNAARIQYARNQLDQALEFYKALQTDFPTSKHANEARQAIAQIERQS